jgi:hypothetical protein
MRWSSMPLGAAATRVGVAGYSGTVGVFGMLAMLHNSWLGVVEVGLAMAPIIGSSVAKVIKARGDAQAARFEALADLIAACQKAASEADALALRAKTQARLLHAGLQPDRTEQAAKMLVLHSINADLPADRRMQDDAIIKLLLPLTKLLTEGSPAPRSPSKGPGSGGTGPRRNVVPIHRRQDELSA